MTDYEHTLTVAIKALSELIEDNRKLAGKLELLELAYEGCTGYKPDYKSLSNLYSKDGAAIADMQGTKDCTSSNQRLAFHCNSKPFTISISKYVFEGLIRECCPDLLDATVSKLAEYLSNKISDADVISDGGDL